jgi:acetyltransferase-like isoleucine patch superfamily enzyme
MNAASLQPSALRRLLRAGRSLLAEDAPYISHPGRMAVGARPNVHPSARFTVLDAELAPQGRIVLGNGVYLGHGVELTAAGGGSVVVGDDTSLQDGDIIYGDVRIGSHCLFGRQVFVASRGHNFRRHPAWLIRDQDTEMLASLPNAGPRTVIEDDCWIGQGAVVSPGLYVGRGAVIGANCVVTRDVGPYEIHGGVPNRRIGTRLDFQPPRALLATQEDHLPYFYRGFALSRSALAQSRTQDAIAARGEALLVLAGAESSRLELRGHLPGRGLRLCVNGIEQSVRASGNFAVQTDVPPASDVRPASLRGHTLVEIAAEGGFSVSAASLS